MTADRPEQPTPLMYQGARNCARRPAARPDEDLSRMSRSRIVPHPRPGRSRPTCARKRRSSATGSRPRHHEPDRGDQEQHAPLRAIEPCLQADDADDGKDEGTQKGRQRISRHTKSAGQADKGRTKPYFPGDRWSSHPIRALEIMGVPRLLSPPARPGLKMIVAPPPRVPAASDAIKCRRPAIIYPAVHTARDGHSAQGPLRDGRFSHGSPGALPWKPLTALPLHRADKPMQGL